MTDDPTTAAVAFENVTVRYGDFRAADDVSFEVRRAEIFGFLGPNGAGKTTSLRVLLDLLRPQAGHTRVFGVDVRAGGAELRRRIGYLPSDFATFPEFTGAEILEVFSRLYDRPPVLRDLVLDRLGFPSGALKRRIRTYSTGMRQMIGVATAFQHDPDLLVLDEPTTGLDPLVRAEFLALLRDAKGRGRTVLFSSHILDEVESVADRVALIHRGRIRLVDSVRALRERLPRTVMIRRRDGAVARYTHAGSAEELLGAIDPRGVVDIEIRPVELAEIFRDVVGAEDAP